MYVNFLVSVPLIWSCIYLSSFLVSKADSGAYMEPDPQQGCQSRVRAELSFLCVLPDLHPLSPAGQWGEKMIAQGLPGVYKCLFAE